MIYFLKNFYLKLTRHDLLNINIIHFLTQVLNFTYSYLQFKQIFLFLIKMQKNMHNIIQKIYPPLNNEIMFQK